MQYLMLIYADETALATMTPENRRSVMSAYQRFTTEVQDKKLYLGGNPLQPTTNATTVRLRDGKTLTTDGPFAETKEQLGGYYLLDCKNLDEAIECAAKIPSAAYGSVE